MSPIVAKNDTGLVRLIKAAGYSWQGLCAAWRYEAAFRQEVVMLVILLPCAVWLGENGIEMALMVASLLLVPMIELLNAAIEAVVDRVGLERHELAGRAKDMGSAAVLIALINAAIVWLLVILF